MSTNSFIWYSDICRQVSPPWRLTGVAVISELLVITKQQVCFATHRYLGYIRYHVYKVHPFGFLVRRFMVTLNKLKGRRLFKTRHQFSDSINIYQYVVDMTDTSDIGDDFYTR